MHAVTVWTVSGYTETRQLGTGATGRVVEAVHDESGQLVAIKYLSRAMMRDRAFVARFRAEARLLAELDVPHVVRLFEYVEEPGQGAAIVMELMAGESLHELIASQGPMSPESALTVLKGSLLGLAAAHTLNVVHRDYKPENVLVGPEGDSKLSDFGIAARAGQLVSFAGTPLYMAPEQWRSGEATPATDIYAATAVFYECLTGKPPYAGRLRQLRREHENAPVPVAEAPEPVQGLVGRGMAKDPADRPADAAAFVSELELVAVAAYGPDWERRGKAALAALLLLLGGVAAATVAGTATATATAGKFLSLHGVQVIAVVGTVAALAGAAVGIRYLSSSSPGGHRPPQHHPSAGASAGANAGPSPLTLTAAASVKPPAAPLSCTSRPASITFTGSVSAAGPGPVRYRWIFSSGRPGRPRTLQFAAAGVQQVAAQVQKATSSRHGWGQIQVLSPVAVTSAKAAYQVKCASQQAAPPVVAAAVFTASAMVTPGQSTVTCGATPPDFTFAGTITASQPGAVTYHWVFSNGTSGPSRTETFGRPGTLPVLAATFAPPADQYAGSAFIAITGPIAARSDAATFRLSCAHPVLAVTLASSPKSPATFACGAARPGFTITGTVAASRATAVTYHWARSDGTRTASVTDSIGAGHTATVTDFWRPPADDFSGQDDLIITAPVRQQQSVPVRVSCTGSHVTGVTVGAGTPTSAVATRSDSRALSASHNGKVSIAYTITVTTEGTGAVQFSWVTSVNPNGPQTGSQDVSSGSETLSGHTSYTVQVTGTFTTMCSGNGAVYLVLSVTATGTDGKAYQGSAADRYTGSG